MFSKYEDFSKLLLLYTTFSNLNAPKLQYQVQYLADSSSLEHGLQCEHLSQAFVS